MSNHGCRWAMHVLITLMLAAAARADDALDANLFSQLGMPAAAADNPVLVPALRSAIARHDESMNRPAGQTPLLNADLDALDRLRAGPATDFNAAEKLAESLVEHYKAPAERGRIYAMLTQVFGQSGSGPETITWARKSLEYPLEPRQQLRMYIYWGDAAFLKDVRRVRAADPAARRDVGKPYLLGIQQALRYSLPPNTPELPAVNRIGRADGNADNGNAHRRQVVARVTAEFIREMVQMRDILIRQFISNSLNLNERDEPRLREALMNPKTVETLLIAAQKDDAGDFQQGAEKLVKETRPQE